MTRTALVTGATGLVGSHIAEKLLADGWTVIALVRSLEKAEWLAAQGAKLVKGDVLNRQLMIDTASLATHVFHTAAAILPRGRSYESYRKLNIDGTKNVIAAAAGSRARLIHLSSVAVYGPTARYADHVTDEDTVLEPLAEGLYYARSKRESEQIVLDAFAKGDVWTTAIRPCVIYGRRDRQFVPRMARAMRLGVLPLPGSGGNIMSIVHASEVADAAILAATTEAAGGRAYNVTTDKVPVTTRQFFELAARGLGRRVRIVSIPVWVTRGALAVARGVAGVVAGSGARAMVRSSLGFVTRDNPFSSERARRELGWTPTTDPRDAIPDAFAWYAQRRG